MNHFVPLEKGWLCSQTWNLAQHSIPILHSFMPCLLMLRQERCATSSLKNIVYNIQKRLPIFGIVGEDSLNAVFMLTTMSQTSLPSWFLNTFFCNEWKKLRSKSSKFGIFEGFFVPTSYEKVVCFAFKVNTFLDWHIKMDHVTFDWIVIDISVCLAADQMVVRMLSTTTSCHSFPETIIREISFVTKARFFDPHYTHVFSKNSYIPIKPKKRHCQGNGAFLPRKYEFSSDGLFSFLELGSGHCPTRSHFLTIMDYISHFNQDTMPFKNLREGINHLISQR